jgi:4-amino-4-deoxychorismate lyase
MSLLVETIKIVDGKLQNIYFHNERMIRTLYMIFGVRKDQNLENIINVPDHANTGTFKCRVLYDDRSIRIEFSQYTIRKVNSLRLIDGIDISYPYKYADRTLINRLFEMRGDCDDIIIVKNGMVTDSSYSNLVFRNINGDWITPVNFLLPGTKRAFLIKEKIITEGTIYITDLEKFTEVRLINAMINLEDSAGIRIGDIH